MNEIILQKHIDDPCEFCLRSIDHDPESVTQISLRGCPDKDWLVCHTLKRTNDIDKEVSFGPKAGAMIRLCLQCTNGLFHALDPDTVLDYRDGGSTPKILNRRE